MAQSAKDQFKELLRELFQLNHTDLDFGIYRILNLKAAEVTQFLDVELDGVVDMVRGKIAGREATEATTTLNEAQQLLTTQFGINFDQPDDLTAKATQYGQLAIFQEPYQKLLQARQQLANVQVSADTERDIYNRLYQFFERYYEEGDFITKPRAGRDAYLIPYNGEEVKLYWANYDQYYIKTGDSFRNYVFTNTATDPALQRTVEFRLRDAESTLNNNKEEKGRLFIPAGLPDSANWFTFADNRLTLWFEYRLPTPDDIAAWEIKPAQRTADKGVVAKLLTLLPDRIGQTADSELIALFQTKRKRGKDSEIATFQYHLERFMAVNKFDYFIHKDLRGFLRRELDFFLKNEVLAVNFLDPNWTDADVQASISLNVTLASTIRQLALTIIEFLGELEEFQKRLFEKRKFVVQADYCLTLDRLPVSSVSSAGNATDRKTSVRDLIFDHILTDPDQKQRVDWQTLGFTDAQTPVDHDYLLTHDKLVLDTAFLPDALKWQLLANLDNLDAQTNGLLLNSENWQALNFLKPKYEKGINAIYTDPPYNTNASEIIYKNSYKHSSWLALMYDRIKMSRGLLEDKGVYCITIDDFELHRLQFLMLEVFGEDNFLANALIRNNPSGRSTVKGFAINHEYGLFYSKSDKLESVGRLPHSDSQIERYDETDDESGKKFEWENFRKSSADSNRSDRRKQYYPVYFNEKLNEVRVPEMTWSVGQDNWIIQEHEGPDEIAIYPINPSGNEKVWQFGVKTVVDKPSLLKVQRTGGRLEVYKKKFLNTKGILPRTWWDNPLYSARDNGTAAISNFFGDKQAFSFPKSVYAVADSLIISQVEEGSTVLDYFAGSGTTGHAVINLNRRDDGDRKYILVEMGQYFDTVTKPRIQKVIYSDTWRDGKPTGTGSSHLFQYLRLEQYEDTLNNIEFSDAVVQGSELSFLDKIRYSLDYGTRSSGSLLNPDKFMRPFSYTLRVVRQNEIRDDQPVDLITTFNYLLGLRVIRYHVLDHQNREYRVVVGQKGLQTYLIIWRDVVEGKPEDGATDFTAERDWILAQPWYDTTALIYANADNGFGARAIETEFVRLLWDSAV